MRNLRYSEPLQISTTPVLAASITPDSWLAGKKQVATAVHTAPMCIYTKTCGNNLQVEYQGALSCTAKPVVNGSIKT